MLEEGSYQNRHMYTNKPNKLLKELTSEKEQKGRRFSEKLQKGRRFSEKLQKGRRFSEKLQKGRRFSEKLNYEDKDNRLMMFFFNILSFYIFMPLSSCGLMIN